MDTYQFTFPQNYSQRMLCSAEQLSLLISIPVISFKKCNEMGMELVSVCPHLQVGCTLQYGELSQRMGPCVASQE